VYELIITLLAGRLTAPKQQRNGHETIATRYGLVGARHAVPFILRLE
jgi:hypothetical protein